MASSTHTRRTIVQLSSCAVRRNALTRGFRNTARRLAAQNLTMPAMSPTMSEGNIASWKVNEGDTFSTGDVLLEIENDKAHMDVEAQDDGKLARIMQQPGAKGVKVGTRTAVLADTDDDLSTLTIPAEPSTSKLSSPDDTNSRNGPPRSSRSQAKASSTSNNGSAHTTQSFDKPVSRLPLGKTQTKQTYPLYPSVVQLLHEQNIPRSEVEKISATGPKGRLLKGDVLAYLGRIASSYSSDQSTRITKLGHLDLSNVKPVPPKEELAPTVRKNEPERVPKPEPTDSEISIPISLSSVFSVQRKVQETLGVTLPLSTFVARATELANDGLPRSTQVEPTSNELFDDILGLTKVKSHTSKGQYIPQIAAEPPQPFGLGAIPQTQPDIYDMLTGEPSSKAKTLPGILVGTKSGEATNTFSVKSKVGEEKRTRVFLERMKTILQVEPGRLVL